MASTATGQSKALKPVQDLSLADLADEYAETRALMAAWRPNVNPHAQRFNDLKAELLSRHEKEPPEKQIQVQGSSYIVPISPRENKRTITDALGLYRRVKKIGETKLVTIYKITLGAVDKLIPDAKARAKYITEERTGPREVGEPVKREARKA